MDSVTEKELIRDALDAFDWLDIETVEDALDAFVSNGEWDELIAREGSEPENAARVVNWILWTDSQGNKSAVEYKDDKAAEKELNEYGSKSQSG